jgi:hypothetical protein
MKTPAVVKVEVWDIGCRPTCSDVWIYAMISKPREGPWPVRSSSIT